MDLPHGHGVQCVAKDALDHQQQIFKGVMEIGLHAISIFVFVFVVDQFLETVEMIEKLLALWALMDL
jgi:hypothetical protein